MQTPIAPTARRFLATCIAALIFQLTAGGAEPIVQWATVATSESFFGMDLTETLSLPLPDSSPKPVRSFGRLPLSFERNEGQAEAEAKFLVRARGCHLFLTQAEAVMVLLEPRKRNADFPVGERARLENRRYGAEMETALNAAPASEGAERLGLRQSSAAFASPRAHPKAPEDWRSLKPGGVATAPQESPTPVRELRMRLAGANPHASISGTDPLPGKVHYFIGKDPSRWRTNISTFAKVRYHEVYPGIDLVYYGNEGQLEYDFVVAPGADPNRIAMEFEGADEVRTDEGGDLVLRVGEREVRWRRPTVYQQVNGLRHEIAGTYRLGTVDSAADAQKTKVQSLHFVSFVLAAYDRALPLVIDPRLVYSTYLGGSGGDAAEAVAVDGEGSVYVAGRTDSIDFPMKAALNNANAGGSQDVFVAKLNGAGELLFSTYLGGSGNDDSPGGHVRIALGSEGQCYVVGTTDSQDFPVVNPVQESYGGGDRDAFVAAIKADGSALLFSTYLGGEESDWAGNVALGPTGDIYVVGGTRSLGFPTRNAFQPQISPMSDGSQLLDGFITRLEAGGKSILNSTYYGRSATKERALDVVVDPDGNAYVALQVFSDLDVYQWLIAKISPDGRSRLFERRWPATMTQQLMLFPKIALAPNGRVVVAGTVEAANLPALNKPNPSMTLESLSDGYVAQFNATNGNFLSAVYLGGSGGESVESVSVDAAGDIIVTGWGAAPDFPVTDPIESGPDPGQSAIYVAKFRPSDLSLTFSTLVGPGGASSGAAIDSTGNLWIVGYTTGQFPTVNAFQPEYGGDTDAFVLKLSFGEKIKINRFGQTLRLSWPRSANGFFLESADSPALAQWNAVPTSPVPEGDQNVVTLEIGNGSKFFRLKRL